MHHLHLLPYPLLAPLPDAAGPAAPACCANNPTQSFTEDGSIVWESKDILLDLERRFPQAPPLLPTAEDEQQAALDFLAELEECGLDKHGYAYMTGGRMMGRNAGADSAPPDMAALEKVGCRGCRSWVGFGLVKCLRDWGLHGGAQERRRQPAA